MKYLVYVLCAALIGWFIYLCRRVFLPRIPGQIGAYRAITPVQLIAITAFFAVLMTVAACAANAGGAAWYITGCILGLAGLAGWMAAKGIPQNVAFSEQGMAMHDLFGPMRFYRWEDITACTTRNESMRGRISYHYVMYCLTLPDRVLRINSGEEAGRELLQVFERCRPDLKAVRLPSKRSLH